MPAPDQTVTLPASGALSGVVNDDGVDTGTPLAIQWSKTSGPGLVTFGNAVGGRLERDLLGDGHLRPDADGQRRRARDERHRDRAGRRRSGADQHRAADGRDQRLGDVRSGAAARGVGVHARSVDPARRRGRGDLDRQRRRDGGSAHHEGDGGSRGRHRRHELLLRDHAGDRAAGGRLRRHGHRRESPGQRDGGDSGRRIVASRGGQLRRHDLAAVSWTAPWTRRCRSGRSRRASTASSTRRLARRSIRPGASARSRAACFNGAMDEVRIWNYARSSAQIQSGRIREISDRERPARPLGPQ